MAISLLLIYDFDWSYVYHFLGDTDVEIGAFSLFWNKNFGGLKPSCLR